MITKNNLKLVLSFFILLFMVINNVSAQQSTNCIYNWTPQISGSTSLLYTVKAVNENICWTAGDNGTVLKTMNGGITWLNANPNPGIIIGNISNIEAIDENNAWTTTSQSINTFIYKTTNGGINWVQVYSQVGGFINGINMTSALDGFAFGNPLSNNWNILVTNNGGSN